MSTTEEETAQRYATDAPSRNGAAKPGGTGSVHYTRDDGVALIELDNPPANVFDYDVIWDFDQAILRARLDEEVHVVLIAAAGERFFSAGADIKMLESVDLRTFYSFVLFASETLHRLELTPQLTIAALNGHAVGGGLEIALSCDLRIAREGTGRVGFPETKLGLIPGLGGGQRLSRVIGKPLAMELMARGQNVSFERAVEIGLVNEILPDEDFRERALDYALQFTPPHGPSKTLGRIKRSVQLGTEIPLEAALALDAELQQELFQSEDAREGITAFNAKREPHFVGR